jgi:xanthine dehydrogenase FAD-binding subunit
VRLKKDQPFNLFTFEKIGQRNALAISIASLAALLRVSEDGFIEDAHFAWGSVGTTIVTSKDVESFLVGKRLGAGALTEAAIIARKAVSPIDDVRASASYRRIVAGNLLLRLAERFEGNPDHARTPLRIGKDWG